jgi:hypothetical protein
MTQASRRGRTSVSKAAVTAAGEILASSSYTTAAAASATLSYIAAANLGHNSCAIEPRQVRDALFLGEIGRVLAAFAAEDAAAFDFFWPQQRSRR